MCFVLQFHLQMDTRYTWCRICTESFQGEYQLVNHMAKKHYESELPYRCEVCNFATSIYYSVIDHFKKVSDLLGFSFLSFLFSVCFYACFVIFYLFYHIFIHLFVSYLVNCYLLMLYLLFCFCWLIFIRREVCWNFSLQLTSMEYLLGKSF